MATEPLMSWEEIVATSQKMTAGGSSDIDRVDAYFFAASVARFDAAIKDGGTKLPVSWRPFAVHVNGYEKGGA